jgi:hypothetical protein
MTTQLVTWTATDANGVAFVNIDHSDDNGVTFKHVGMNEPNDGSFDWFVPNRPGSSNNIIRVVARDIPGNWGSGWSAVFTITGTPAGYVPTTMRDIDMPGSQPFEARTFEDPDDNCKTCHGDYNQLVEPWYLWKGSMMGQAMRDPLFTATVVIAEQDAPSSGDLCLRCHTPTGWLEGRSVDTGGGLLIERDLQGISCDWCHRLVDPVYVEGVSPEEDEAIIDSLSTGPPPAAANGQFVNDPAPIRRGPRDDAQADHAFLDSQFHRDCNICGTCHDVSNPVYVAGATPGDYVLDPFDAPHPDTDKRNMMPVERTFSEWKVSEYATTGVFAPQFAGSKVDGIVSTCQDCHMRDVSGKSAAGGPVRSDMAMHDMTGGNHFVPDILPSYFPGEVDAARLQAGKQRAISMLQLAATMSLTPGQVGARRSVTVTVTNETGHKLPSGYPEGRRIWLNVKGYDIDNNLVYESGAYDASTGVLTKDDDVKVYEIKPGLSPAIAAAIGMPAGVSFHFVLNDTVYGDNRIPPRGFTNAAFETIQSPVVAHTYADGQYWDETTYILPYRVNFVEARLYYQTTSKEYIEFLRDENDNPSPNEGDDLYDAWVAQGRCAPVEMVFEFVNISEDPTGIGDTPMVETALHQNHPNPFNPSTTIRYSLKERQWVSIKVYDAAGRLVRTLVDGERPAGLQRVTWYGVNNNGVGVASGVYFIKMRAAGFEEVRKATFLK